MEQKRSRGGYGIDPKVVCDENMEKDAKLMTSKANVGWTCYKQQCSTFCDWFHAVEKKAWNRPNSANEKQNRVSYQSAMPKMA